MITMSHTVNFSCTRLNTGTRLKTGDLAVSCSLCLLEGG